MIKFIISALLVISFITPSITSAGERVVQLNLSGCTSCNATGRIEKILKRTKGVKKYVNKGRGVLVVTFDDEVTTLGIIVNELKRGKLFVEGEVIFIK